MPADASNPFSVLQVAMMTGAKIDELRELIEKHI
jgi:hypothetical protein